VEFEWHIITITIAKVENLLGPGTVERAFRLWNPIIFQPKRSRLKFPGPRNGVPAYFNHWVSSANLQMTFSAFNVFRSPAFTFSRRSSWSDSGFLDDAGCYDLKCWLHAVVVYTVVLWMAWEETHQTVGLVYVKHSKFFSEGKVADARWMPLKGWGELQLAYTGISCSIYGQWSTKIVLPFVSYVLSQFVWLWYMACHLFSTFVASRIMHCIIVCLLSIFTALLNTGMVRLVPPPPYSRDPRSRPWQSVNNQWRPVDNHVLASCRPPGLFTIDEAYVMADQQ